MACLLYFEPWGVPRTSSRGGSLTLDVNRKTRSCVIVCHPHQSELLFRTLPWGCHTSKEKSHCISALWIARKSHCCHCETFFVTENLIHDYIHACTHSPVHACNDCRGLRIVNRTMESGSVCDMEGKMRAPHSVQKFLRHNLQRISC